MSRLRVLLSVELDDELLVIFRDDCAAEGPLYTEELGKTVRHWPGAPHEWTSILDVRDLEDAGVIVRTEVLEVTKAPPPYSPEEPGLLRRLFDKLTRKGSRS
jgi:hypothetical protein